MTSLVAPKPSNNPVSPRLTSYRSDLFGTRAAHSPASSHGALPGTQKPSATNNEMRFDVFDPFDGTLGGYDIALPETGPGMDQYSRPFQEMVPNYLAFAGPSAPVIDSQLVTAPTPVPMLKPVALPPAPIETKADEDEEINEGASWLHVPAMPSLSNSYIFPPPKLSFQDVVQVAQRHVAPPLYSGSQSSNNSGSQSQPNLAYSGQMKPIPQPRGHRPSSLLAPGFDIRSPLQHTTGALPEPRFHPYTRPSSQNSHSPALRADHPTDQTPQLRTKVRITRKNEVRNPDQNEGTAGHRERGGSQVGWMHHSSIQAQNGSNISGNAIADTSIVASSATISSTTKAQCRPQMIGHTTPLAAIIGHLVAHGCLDVSEQLKNIDEYSRYSGSLSDVYQARWTDGSLVAVKCLRALSNSDIPPGKLLKQTARELYTWSRADHSNILKLHGFALVRGKLAMIAPWMEYTSLLAYIRARPRVDRCGLCTQIAAGLSYMHNLGLVHGDVKGNNVVVSEDGIAKLTDFGSTTMTREFEVAFTATQTVNYSIRWAAPELFLSQSSSFESDVYAFAKTMLEALSGDIPHKGMSDFAIMRSVSDGKFPNRPLEHIPPWSKKGDGLWSILVQCWSMEPAQRPTIRTVLKFIASVTQEDLRWTNWT